MTARIETPREAEKLKGKSSKDILQAVQGADVKITGMRRLSSGEVSFHTRPQKVRDTLQANTEWTKAIATSARVQKQTFAAFTHGVWVKNVITTNQIKAIADLKKANEWLHESLDVIRVSWPTWTIKSGKTWSLLHIKVAFTEMANRLITEGHLWRIMRIKNVNCSQGNVRSPNISNFNNTATWVKQVGTRFVVEIAQEPTQRTPVPLQALHDTANALFAKRTDTRPRQQHAKSEDCKDVERRWLINRDRHSTLWFQERALQSQSNKMLTQVSRTRREKIAKVGSPPTFLHFPRAWQRQDQQRMR